MDANGSPRGPISNEAPAPKSSATIPNDYGTPTIANHVDHNVPMVLGPFVHNVRDNLVFHALEDYIVPSLFAQYRSFLSARMVAWTLIAAGSGLFGP